MEQSQVKESVAVANSQKVLVEFKCEVPGCEHPSFQTDANEPYVEAHHIIPLADGGEDTLENLICICPTHHAEAHLGVERDKLKSKILQYRKSRLIKCLSSADQNVAATR